MLRGRDGETARIDAIVADARSGRGGALVLRGEAGIGKSALLEYARSRATGMRVLRGAGVEAESELPYAGLHLLLGRAVERAETLPGPQARALRGALGSADDGEPNRFLVGLAVLTLLADLAETEPVLCLVDDAHWLDQASAGALLFAARRLEAERVAVLMAVREPHAPQLATPHVDELPVRRLPRADAEELLRERAVLPRRERERVLAEAAGNPLALLTLSDTRGDDGTGARFGELGRVQNAFAERVAALPEPTRALVLVAAADDSGEIAAVLRAAADLGARGEDLRPAEDEGLLRVREGRVEFGHPLVRSAVYQGATSDARAAAHRALATVFASRPETADRRAWHLAAASAAPDERVAALLVETAERARTRGGLSAVSAAYERAAALSPDPGDRSRRTVAAAEAAVDAGDLARAAGLVSRVDPYRGDLAERAAVARLHARLAVADGKADEAHRILFGTVLASGGAEPAGAGSAGGAAETGALLVDAVRAAWVANDFDCVAGIGAYAARFPEGAPARTLARAALATNRLDHGHVAEGVRELRSLLAEPSPAAEAPRDRVTRARLHLAAGDLHGAHRLATDLERECRHQGAMAVLPGVQVVLAHTQTLLGRLRDARATLADGLRNAAETCQDHARVELLSAGARIAALQGDDDRCRALAAEPLELGTAPACAQAAAALSLLDLGRGRYEEAVVRMEAVVAGDRPMGVVGSLPVLVEAAFRLGRPDRAADAADRYALWAEATRQPWARAVALRCRALLDGSGADFQRALELDALPFDRALTRLLYGEWLRRRRRMTEARRHLRTASEDFLRWRAEPWAARARAELRATGEIRATDPLARDGAEELLDRLTPQELQVVRLAATGLSNREIGARLFLSPRTVGHHLYKAYPKLGVASRTELGALGLHREPPERHGDERAPTG
ncbi:LuxR family transcriptional regulator [Nocardiopsis sp. NPDC049922]|uniref:helix-turn-helix transcriptional regulator n=1 Tax=Nocardiopsis sp. NPDC049922 TaxID=3155157 RepID=UPI0033D7DFB7